MAGRISTRQLCAGAMFCALTAACSQLTVNIGPVPVSMSLVAVYLCGALLPPRTAAAAQLAYLALGAAGAPVFTNFGAGAAKLLGPTGGYLFTYPAMALLVALAARRFGCRSGVLAAAMAAATVLCYAVGTLWLCRRAGLAPAAGLQAGVWPFVPFDALKIWLCCRLAPAVAGRLAAGGPT